MNAPSCHFRSPTGCLPTGVNKAFPDMGILKKYDHIEPIYLPQSVVTYIYLHPV
jgi:hypothetical protein